MSSKSIKKASKIEWPADWDPDEGWPTSMPGISDAAVAKCVETLGGPKAPSRKEGAVMSTSKKIVSEAAVVARIKRKLAHNCESISLGANPWCGGGERLWRQVDSRSNTITGTIEDLESFAKELGVMHESEVLP